MISKKLDIVDNFIIILFATLPVAIIVGNFFINFYLFCIFLIFIFNTLKKKNLTWLKLKTSLSFVKKNDVDLAFLSSFKADFILDLVQSGKTLKDNQLYENQIINNDISTVIISSYFAYDTKKNFIKKLLNKGL